MHHPTYFRRELSDGTVQWGCIIQRFFLGSRPSKQRAVAFRAWHVLGQPTISPSPAPAYVIRCKPLSRYTARIIPQDGSVACIIQRVYSSADGRARNPLHPEHGNASTTDRLPGMNIQPSPRWKPHYPTILQQPVERAESRYIQSTSSHQPTVSPAITSNRLAYGNPYPCVRR